MVFYWHLHNFYVYKKYKNIVHIAYIISSIHVTIFAERINNAFCYRCQNLYSCKLCENVNGLEYYWIMENIDFNCCLCYMYIVWYAGVIFLILYIGLHVRMYDFKIYDITIIIRLLQWLWKGCIYVQKSRRVSWNSLQRRKHHIRS